MTMTATTIPNDPERCDSCGERAQVRTCATCGKSARLIDCGHYGQPCPIAAGRADGMDGGHDFCQPCAQVTRGDIAELRGESGEAGDLEQVAVCDDALAGDAAAWRECLVVIADARAQED